MDTKNAYRPSTHPELWGQHPSPVADIRDDTLPVGTDHEIHPAAESGRWVVVNNRTGQVAAIYDDLDEAVSAAERLESDD